MNKQRYHVLDYIRAFVILNMILFHLIWDLVYMYGKEFLWYEGISGEIWERFICFGFILLSGFSLSLAGNPLKRGAVIFLCGAIISFVTLIFMPENIIKYGILTFIGTAVMITSLLKNHLNKIQKESGFIISLALYIVSYNINEGSILFSTLSLPRFLYRGEVMAFLGFTYRGFFSADYFSFLPWFFLFLTGFYLYGIMEKRKILHILKGVKITSIEFISRYSLLIYMLHQPVIYGILQLIYHNF